MDSIETSVSQHLIGVTIALIPYVYEIQNKKKAAKISGLKFYKTKNSPALLD